MINSTLAPSVQEVLLSTNRKEAYYRLVAIYMQGPDEIREIIRKQWDFGMEWIYPNPRRLACSINEGHSCRERALALLVYEAIMDLRQSDLRDELMTLAIVYHGCIAAGIKPKDVFEEVASVSSSRTARFLLDFIKRSPHEKSLEAFMLVAEKNADDEIEIVPSWIK